MPHPPQVSVRTMALVVLVAALDFWLLIWLTRTHTVTRGAGLSPPGAAIIVGLVASSALVIGLVTRRGVDRTLAHSGLTTVLTLGLIRLAAATDLVGALIALGAALILGTLLMAFLLAPEAREYRSTWWWEVGATVAASIASVILMAVIVTVLGTILVMTITLN